MISICLVVAYFGKLPDNFQLWLNSCSYNDTIDWLFFTDDDTEYKYPENFAVTIMSFDDMKKRIQSYYDFHVSIKIPYRLCDFRPAFGEIFRVELDGYDFWGHCDIDLVFGNIRKFITEDILSSYDKILVSGPLTLFRNDEHALMYYRDEILGSYIYKEVFSVDINQNYAFDESHSHSITAIYRNRKLRIYEEIIFRSIYFGKYAFYSLNQLVRKEKHNSSSIFLWQEGSLYRFWVDKTTDELCKEEIIYVHLPKRKMKVETDAIKAIRVLIRPNLYEKYDGIIDANLVVEAGKDKLIYPDYLKRRFKNIPRRLQRYYHKLQQSIIGRIIIGGKM